MCLQCYRPTTYGDCFALVIAVYMRVADPLLNRAVSLLFMFSAIYLNVLTRRCNGSKA
jgi:hypothetical protein